MGIHEQVRAFLQELDGREHQFHANVEDAGSLFQFLQQQRGQAHKVSIGSAQIREFPIHEIEATAYPDSAHYSLHVLIRSDRLTGSGFSDTPIIPLPFNLPYFKDYIKADMYHVNTPDLQSEQLMYFSDHQIVFVDTNDRKNAGTIALQVVHNAAGIQTEREFLGQMATTIHATEGVVNAIFEGENDAKIDRRPSPQTIFFFRPPIQIDQY